MHRLLAILAATFSLISTPPLVAQDAGPSIRDVISQQLGSISRDDWAGAFKYASPMIQRMFKTPENFGDMVRKGYPMVWRPSEREFGELEPRGERQVQIVFLRDQSGQPFIAEYEMIQVNGTWRINGVRIIKGEDIGV